MQIFVESSSWSSILLKIVENALDLRKNVPIFQVWGSAQALPTPPVFREVLLQTEATRKC